MTPYRILIAIFALGLCTDVFAGEKLDYAQISFCMPGPSKHPVPPQEFVMLVVEGAGFSCDRTPVPGSDVVEYVNKTLEVKNASYIGVYVREGTKYGDVVRALDLLRGSKAKSIGVSMKELPVGREP